MTASHRRPVLIAALALGALSSVAGASAAQAATLSANKACYVNGATVAQVSVSGQGFTPGDEIIVSGDGFSASATAGPTGTFTATGPAPTLPSGPMSEAVKLTATDETTPGPTTTLAIHVANLAVSVSRSLVKNVSRDKVMFTFSGFTPGKPVYGYYLRRKVVAKARFGRAAGPCGTLRQRALLYPNGHPPNTLYTVVFEDSSHYSKTSFPRVTGRLNILHF